MAIFRSSTPRRRGVRRSIPRRPSGWGAWLREPEVLWAGLYTLLLTLAALAMGLAADDRPRLSVGEVLREPIVARVEFSAIDEAATAARREAVWERQPAVYVPNTPFFQTLEERLIALVTQVEAESIETVEHLQADEAMGLTPEALERLRSYVAESGGPDDRWRQLVEEFLRGGESGGQGLAGIPVLAADRAEQERSQDRMSPKIVIVHPLHGEQDRFYNVLISERDDPALLQQRVAVLADRFPSELRSAVTAVTMSNIQPTYLHDADATLQRREAAAAAVPSVEVTRERNKVLVPAGRQLTSDDLKLIRLEAAAYEDRLATVAPISGWLSPLGRAGVLLALALAMWSYALTYNRRIAFNPMRGLALTGLMLLALSSTAILVSISPWLVPVAATFPPLTATMVLAIAYDRRFAMVAGGVLSLVLLATFQLPMLYIFALLAGVAAAVGQLPEVRTRSKLLVTGAWSGAAMAATFAAASFAVSRFDLPGQIYQITVHVALVLISGVGTGMLVQVVLPAIERLFKVTTSMTLKELNDASHPLLRRLAQEAPGTYQHSLRIADMAEAAAEAIGVNALLCRVGAMYHDIGKINKPQYFIENQGGGPNRHEKLPPSMSLLIIVGHVKDGVEMAREYGLPPAVRHFIESHHGTTLVEFFFHAAKQKRQAEEETPPSEFEFRYPGPKPQTKEAAIMMLCDAVEGAARTLPEPSPARFEQLVHTMAQKRLTDGQFDECSLTLQELYRIEQPIIKTLCAMYHGRIAYPGDAAPVAAPATAS